MQDFVEAYRWSKLAQSHGHEMAKALLRDLTRQMSPEQIVAANKRIDAGFSRDKVKSVAGTAAFIYADPAIAEKSVPDTVVQLQDTSVVVPDNVSAVADDIYVQLGAFRSEMLAEKFMTLLSAKLGDVGRPFSLFRKNELVRIQVGPYQNMSEARLCADRLKDRVGVEPLLQQH